MLVRYKFPKFVVDGINNLVFFLFADHLGSTNVTSDPNGLMVSLSLYKPWGESRGGAGTTLTDYGFTGQRNDDIGLYYYNARWYDSTLGRFITEDPARDGSNWGIYSSDNPTSRYDPYGNVLASSGSGESEFAFTGEQMDGYSNLINLRARFYCRTSER